ncbi:MAG: hypothetical protein SGBAC_000376 [Bacillariaceae sp.]
MKLMQQETTTLVNINSAMEDVNPAFVVAGLVVLITVFYFHYNRDTASEPTGKAATSKSNDSKSTTKLKNVWDVSKNSKTSHTKKHHEDVPFESKYYYAHNNPNATGGYKDGLKMEDYVMNGPRLLSKGGKTVESGSSLGEGNDDEAEPTEPTEPQVEVEPKATPTVKQIRAISKYLWDDTGNSNGIATIRIDTLPDKHGKPIDWKDATVTNITAKLAGEGMLLKVESAECDYQLKIAKLYGDASEVKAVSKAKRLLVKITKKKIAVLAKRKESNMDAWPQPHRKM